MSLIVVFGNAEEPMIQGVQDELARRGDEVVIFSDLDLLTTVSLGCEVGAETTGFLETDGGRRIGFEEISGVYQRIGLEPAEVEGYSTEESAYASAAAMAAISLVLNAIPATVVNRPAASGSNVSKPYQSGLIEALGFIVPKTLVTNDATAAAAFFEACGGQVIYKSISSVRSIVVPMTEADLERLDALRNCPVQLQELVPGRDVRVHVVGPSVFAHIIASEQTDYRYDSAAAVAGFKLPPQVEEMCRKATTALALEMSGIDLRKTPDGRWVCFEVNPSPAFSYFEQRTGQPVTAALCDLLTGRVAPAPAAGRR